MAGDLRWCVIESLFRADTINFSVSGTINLALVLPTLTRSVSIEGPGADFLTVRRNTGGDYRIFTVPSGVTGSISGLTITNGNANGTNGGGGIWNSGMVTLSDTTISGNSAVPGGGAGILNDGTLMVNNSRISGGNYAGIGGAMVNDGTAMLNHSSISDNSAGNGGGIYNFGTLTINSSTVSGNFGEDVGGGIINRGGGLTITNSTVAGNSAHGNGGPGNGGGISNETVGTLTINNSTIAGNSAIGQGGGIFVDGSSQMASRNTIIAGNMAVAGSDVYGNLGSQGHNLIGNPQDMTGWVATDLLHVNPLLGPLQDNGGPTKTIALLAGSPALNAGDAGELGVADQRGVVRAGGVNIGAYQASASAFVLTAPPTVTAGMPFDVTVKAVDTFGQTAIGYSGTVTFTSADPYGATLPADYPFVAADNGAHTFPLAGTLYTAGAWDVTATDTGTASIAGGASVSVTPAAADHLLFLQQPTDAAPGQTITPAVMVAVVDQFGNVLTDDNTDTVTLSIGTNPSGGTLSGTLTVTVVNGIATFSDLSIDQIGDGYTLHATVTGLMDADSAAFSITA
jgi:hypothetical protein